VIGPASTSALQEWALLISAMSPVLLAVIGLFQRAHNKKSDEHNARSEKQQASIKETGEATHVLVNNEHGLTLRLAAEALRHVADLTHLPEDVAKAVKAEANSAAHDQRQGDLNGYQNDLKDK
jgi:hypothetical protein